MATILASTPAGAGQQPNVLYLSTYAGIDRTGVSDSHTGFLNAMAACAGKNITMVVDCPVRLVIGFNAALPIVVPSFLNIDFTANGMILVDNVFVPAFCFLHSTDCTWNNAHIRYVGSFPLDINGNAGYGTGSANWNDVTVKGILTSQFGNTFTNGASGQYYGATNAMAVIAFRGGNRRLTFNNLVMDVPSNALATQFIPIGISFDAEWTPNTTVNTNNSGTHVPTSANSVIPQDVVINNLIMDGYLMGCVGAGGITLNSPIFKRYSDLQDASYVTNGTGANWGGINSTYAVGATGYYDWFPPPHCLYLQAVDASLACTKVVNNGYDYGIYVGGTTRRAASSGSMCALKIAPQFGTRINGFKTMRPDGLIDILSYNITGTPGGGELNDIVASAYDSSLVHQDGGNFPAVRFTGSDPYTNLTINRMSITDVATKPVVWAINADNFSGNYCVEINDFQYRMNDFPTNGWGFNVQGTNMRLTGDIYLANCTSTKTYVGLISTSSPNLTNAYYNLRLWGWRIINTLTFSAAPSGSSATLSANWLFPTDQYVVTFPSGQQRLVTLTLNANTATWSPALPAAEANATFTVNCITSGNINAYRDRINFGGGGVTGIYSYIKDMSNGLTIEDDNGVVTEKWSQFYSGSPIGATQATTISFPSTFAVDRVGCAVATTMGTVPSFGVGWSGTPTALLTAQSTSSSNNAAIPLDNTWPKSLSGSARTILLTPTSGTFDGTGVLRLTVRGKRMYGAG